MVIADFIAAPFIVAGAMWLIRVGVKIWRSPGGDAPSQLMVVGWDRAVLMMGIALAWMAVAVLGQALLGVTRSPVTRWAFGVGAVAMVVSACLFASIWFFNRPRFLVPPGVAGPAGHPSCAGPRLGRPPHPEVVPPAVRALDLGLEPPCSWAARRRWIAYSPRQIAGA